jgi:hypothetical protein
LAYDLSLAYIGSAYNLGQAQQIDSCSGWTGARSPKRAFRVAAAAAWSIKVPLPTSRNSADEIPPPRTTLNMAKKHETITIRLPLPRIGDAK